jgi:hypothetical protein
MTTQFLAGEMRLKHLIVAAFHLSWGEFGALSGAQYRRWTMQVRHSEERCSLGHLVASAYDYVVPETLGFRVDDDKTLGKQLDETRSFGTPMPKFLKQARFDSLL